MKIFSRGTSDHWRNYEYCSVDIETTGLNLKSDEVISIGAVSIVDGRFKKDGNFYQEIAPLNAPSASSVQVHGLRGVDLIGAQPASDVIPDLVIYMQGKYLIAHAGWVEKAFLADHFKSLGIPYPRKVIDTAGLARHFGIATNEVGHEPSLELLARSLNLPVFTPHHALGDAMTTAAVFLALATKIEQHLIQKNLGALTLKQIIQYSKSK